jgi:hypothetical protein
MDYASCWERPLEGRKRGGWSRLGSLGRFEREGERIREKRRRE